MAAEDKRRSGASTAGARKTGSHAENEEVSAKPGDRSDRELASIIAFTRRLRRRLVAVEAGSALLQGLAVALLLGLAAVWAEHLLYPGPFWRTALVLASLAAAVAAAGLRAYSRLRGRLSWHRVGLLAERDLGGPPRGA